jgi:DnaK suppressor protein
MNATTTDRYRQQLLALADRLRGEVSELRDEAFAAPDGLADTPADQEDIAAHEAEEGRVRQLLVTEAATLEAVEAALARIDRGTFGRCEGCGHPISAARLHAVPFTAYCIGCARRHEA